jgi:hypothetical protein
MFWFPSTSEGVDHITDFTIGNLNPNNPIDPNADMLNLHDVLGGFPSVVNAVGADNAAALTGFLNFDVAGTTATLQVDTSGTGNTFTNLATFEVASGTAPAALLTTLLANDQIVV